MPRTCKPTEEAVNMRMEAYLRLLRMKDAYNYPSNVFPIEIFGIKHKIMQEGIFSMDDIIRELENDTGRKKQTR